MPTKAIRDKDFALYRIANYFKYHLKLFENRKIGKFVVLKNYYIFAKNIHAIVNTT